MRVQSILGFRAVLDLEKPATRMFVYKWTNAITLSIAENYNARCAVLIVPELKFPFIQDFVTSLQERISFHSGSVRVYFSEDEGGQ